MEKIGINSANKVLSWVTVSFLIIGVISFIWMMNTIFGSFELVDMLNAEQLEAELLELEENLLTDEDALADILISSLLFSLSSLAVVGLSIAGLVVSIISLIKCNKYKLSIAGSVLTLIGFSIALCFNVTIISITAIVLLIIGAIKMKEVSTISYEKLEELNVLKKA